MNFKLELDMKNDFQKKAKKAAKKAGELYAAKKGLQWTGGLLKIGLIAGVGYYAYKFIRKHEDEIKEKLSF